jgi:hypothetical protein
MNKHYLSQILAFSVATLTGCASVTDGTSQTLIFNLMPSESRCSVSRDGAELGSVTGRQNTLNVSKGSKDLLITCRADGYLQHTQRLVSSTQTAGATGVLLDFGITDMVTGAMWKYPGDISIVMVKDVKAKP